MGQIIFTEFELQVLETARIVGGKGMSLSKTNATTLLMDAEQEASKTSVAIVPSVCAI